MSSAGPASRRRRSGSEDADKLLEKQARSRKHFTPERQRKWPTLYDEWLKEEKQEHAGPHAQQQSALQQTTSASVTEPSSTSERSSTPQEPDNSTPASTIKTVPAEDAHDDDDDDDDDDADSDTNQHTTPAERSTSSFEQTFVPQTVTSPPAGDKPILEKNGTSRASAKTRRLVKDKERPREGRRDSNSSKTPTNHGTLEGTSYFNRRMTKRSEPSTEPISAGSEAASRPRTKSHEERRREQSPPALTAKNKKRVGSFHPPPSPAAVAADQGGGGADELASAPASTHTPSAPSVSSIGSPVQSPFDAAGRRSISPMSSSTLDSVGSAIPTIRSKRILPLMHNLNGSMSGIVIVRRGPDRLWSQTYVYIRKESGSLMSETGANESEHEVLISDLRRSHLRTGVDNEIPYLELVSPHSSEEAHLKLLSSSDFDAWFAALLYWRSPELPPTSGGEARPGSATGMRQATSAAAGSPWNKYRDRAGSKESDQRDPETTGTSKETTIIKIGKMVYWDMSLGYGNHSPNNSGYTSAPRAHDTQTQSVSARRWRKINAQLRENGEFQLHADYDNTLLSVVQLSQLSRCAVQRLHSSVLNLDYCLAIYPQYTSTFATDHQSVTRPIFLSLEDRVLHEVWYVLLRAFTMPSLYGPRISSPDEPENGDPDADQLENMLATTSTDMFRMERSLGIRLVEAKMSPLTANASAADLVSGGSHSRGHQHSNSSLDRYGYFAEILLDNETRGKTSVKYEGPNPLWGDYFEFRDLPPILASASVAIKRRPPEHLSQERIDSRIAHEASVTGDQHGGYTNLSFDVTCGKVEIYLQELEEDKEVEKYWPLVNMFGQQVGEVLIKARAEESVILMSRDYQPLSDLLHQFSNGLTSQIAQKIPAELKRVSDILLDIFQVSGKVSDWIMALIEEEIDGIHKETSINRLRYNSRAGSSDGDPYGTAAAAAAANMNSDRELIVRDLNKNATLEANLLFRGNTLLTKSLDSHMRRVGIAYLEKSLGAKLQQINEKNPNCEVDPNRVSSQHEIDRNWKRLLAYTQEVWTAIVSAESQCPVELRLIFRHVRACAEDRYGDFLRSVTYSSVSGFLFLRFFCPAVMNPNLFRLLRGDAKPKARRAFTLIAKSLQTLANMATFGAKEPWMEPMNAFILQHRESFKNFIDRVCSVPPTLSYPTEPTPSTYAPAYGPSVVTAEQHPSYVTPMTIMQRLPPSSREGFPSLPYLIDQARTFAELIQFWLQTTYAINTPQRAAATATEESSSEAGEGADESEGVLHTFHQLCTGLSTRTQECLSRAERAERPRSAASFRWDELIDQLQTANVHAGDMPTDVFDALAENIAADPSVIPDDANLTIEATLAQLRNQMVESDDEQVGSSGHYDHPKRNVMDSSSLKVDIPRSHGSESVARPGSSSIGSGGGQSNSKGGLMHIRSLESPTHFPTSTSGSNVSAFSSDMEGTPPPPHKPTPASNYEREIRHHERREAARKLIQQQVEAARTRILEKEHHRGRRMKDLVPTFRPKHKHERHGSRLSASDSHSDDGGKH